jgi:hypothetical protein
MSPGWARSDMGGPKAPKTLAEGADTAVWLATLPKRGPHGGFFRERSRFPGSVARPVAVVGSTGGMPAGSLDR